MQLARRRVVPAVGIAVAVYLSARSYGAYFPSEWPLLAAAVILPTIGLLVVGRRPPRWVAGGALGLVAYGAWSLASVAWGGVPDVAWTTFDQAVLAGAALILGSLVAGAARSRWVVVLGVTVGLTAEAAELLYRLQAGPVSSEWFAGRKVQGPVGYANAQAALLAVGVPFAVWLAARSRLPVRAAAGAAAGLLVGGVLLTQSRGALLTLAVALVIQVALSREIRVAGVSLAIGVDAAALLLPLRRVDHALVAGTDVSRVEAFRHDVRWVVVGAVALAVVSAILPRARVSARTLAVALATLAVVTPTAVVLVRPGTIRDVRRAFTGPRATEQPAYLPAGNTRLTSLSFTGRRATWRVALRLYERHPVLGGGKGTFSRAWDRERPNHNLSVLQPHSLELEALSELGPVGLLALAGFIVCAFTALVRARRRSRTLAAAGIAALAVLLLQASFDWTFSFPALVVAVLVGVGAASGPGTRRTPPLAMHLGLILIAAAAFVAFGAQYLSTRKLAQADRALTHDPSRAWSLASEARGYDRWNADVVSLQARIADATGKLALSASLYARAAQLAERPWMQELYRAQVLAKAGRTAASRDACRAALADNPLEVALRTGVCGDVSP